MIQLDHQARPIEAREPAGAGVHALAQPQPIPEPAKKHQTRAVGQLPGRVAQAQRRRAALHRRTRSDSMDAYRLGASPLKETSWRNFRQHKASDGVLHPPFNPTVQDPSSVVKFTTRPV